MFIFEMLGYFWWMLLPAVVLAIAPTKIWGWVAAASAAFFVGLWLYAANSEAVTGGTQLLAFPAYGIAVVVFVIVLVAKVIKANID